VTKEMGNVRGLKGWGDYVGGGGGCFGERASRDSDGEDSSRGCGKSRSDSVDVHCSARDMGENGGECVLVAARRRTKHGMTNMKGEGEAHTRGRVGPLVASNRYLASKLLKLAPHSDPE